MTPPPSAARTRARVVLADRGDALVPHLHHALRQRYEVVGDVDAELTRAERLVVAGTTFRPSRQRWVELFYKSNPAVALRSRRARRRVAAVTAPFDAVIQTHALFELTDPRTVMYVDCTHRQSAEQWPEWNPLRGKALQRWFVRERRQYHTAAHLFAFSVETRDSLVDDYDVPPERVSVVGAGVNFDRLPAPRTAAPEVPTILFVGNDFERKGGLELLAAFALVREQVPNARLRIVGTPYPVPAQAGVEVLGRVNGREAMSRLYAEASVFCLPSFFDPFPLVLLEAMSHRLPTVATRTCGVPEIVADGATGLLVGRGAEGTGGPEMVAELAAALVRVLTDGPYAARLGAAGRRRVEERFTWTHVVDRMAPAVDTLGGVRSARPVPLGAAPLEPPQGDADPGVVPAGTTRPAATAATIEGAGR